MVTGVGRFVRFVTTWIACVTVVGAACAERQPARSFSELQQRVRPGKTVYVIDDTGIETKGKIVEITSSALRFNAGGVERRLDESTLRQLQTFGDPLWNGLILGVAAGIPAALIADPTYDPCPDNPSRRCANSQIGQRILAVGIMGGIGASIDALIRGRHQIYLSPGQPLPSAGGVSVAPRFSASAVALVVTYRWALPDAAPARPGLNVAPESSLPDSQTRIDP